MRNVAPGNWLLCKHSAILTPSSSRDTRAMRTSSGVPAASSAGSDLSNPTEMISLPAGANIASAQRGISRAGSRMMSCKLRLLPRGCRARARCFCDHNQETDSYRWWWVKSTTNQRQINNVSPLTLGGVWGRQGDDRVGTDLKFLVHFGVSAAIGAAAFGAV